MRRFVVDCASAVLILLELKSCLTREQILGKGNLTRDEFNSMFLEECFRRFETMPWDSKDFSQQDRDELLQLWETVKPQSKADVDRPLPRKKYHQVRLYYISCCHQACFPFKLSFVPVHHEVAKNTAAILCQDH